MRRTDPVLVIGGGIGGMALALSLHDAGFSDIRIFESGSASSELGASPGIKTSAPESPTPMKNA